MLEVCDIRFDEGSGEEERVLIELDNQVQQDDKEADENKDEDETPNKGAVGDSGGYSTSANDASKAVQRIDPQRSSKLGGSQIRYFRVQIKINKK